MKLRRKKKKIFIPLFSMSDIAFLLLIFIMLVSLINYRKEVNIEYPVAQTGLRTNAEKNMDVWIDINGRIYIDGNAADRNALEWKIADLSVNAPDTRVHIIADRGTPYSNVNSVLESFQVLQYRFVSFAVKNDE
ncbi:MAG: biopolymer transporter ExbD [Treponema sp.]|jgi:biopolymer transport protein ExbD|nr:biopolymer transporter ExbD [Treponema sp.]